MPHRPPPSRLRQFFQPLRRRLPLLISALLVVVVGAFGWLARDRVHDAIEASATERLTAAATHVASLLARTAAQYRLETAATAGDPAVVAALATPVPTGTAAARAALARPAPGSGRTPSRALFTRECRLVVAVGPHAREARCPGTPAMRQGRVGGFRPLGDSVLVDVTAPVRTASGDILGFVAEVRRPTGTGAKPVGRLLGEGVSVRIGTPHGSFWTDMLRPVPGPRTLPPRGALLDGVGVGGTRYFRVATDVPGADWVLMVQIPHTTVEAPMRGIVAEMLLLALGCIVAGGFGAWIISRHVTAPLAEMERAAQAIATGQYARRVAARRGDEMGDLARSFNIMAERVDTAQALISGLLASAPFGAILVDRELRLVRTNPAMVAISACDPEKAMGRTPSENEPQLGALLEPLLRSAIETESPVMNRRLTLLGGSGAKQHLVATAFPVRDAAGAITGAGLFMLDVTAHRELEARYLQAQKMDAVGRLAGGVAHDFNNLLTVILSYTVMSIDTLPRGSTLRSDLEEIRDAGERAAALTKQLLAFSRNSVQQPRVMSLNDVAARMERMLRRLLGEDVTLEMSLAEDLALVSADPGQMEQVIMNLAVNARDAMPGGGRLFIETANVLLPTVRAAGFGAGATEYVMLVVRDEGVGMSLEVQQHLFEPFYTTKGAGEGTGLGLATVYGIVTQSGGEIQVQSSPGEGTTFTIYFPRAAEELLAAAGTATRDPGAGSETILLVEDDEALQALGARLLRRAGYTVLCAKSPEDAVETARTHGGTIDLLLTDVVMPGMHGGAVADELERLRPGIRVLFMSGYPDEEIVRRGIVAEGSAFIQKPFTPAELTRRVREALDGRVAA